MSWFSKVMLAFFCTKLHKFCVMYGVFDINHENMLPVKVYCATGVNVRGFFGFFLEIMHLVLEIMHQDFQTSFNLFLSDQCKQHVFDKDQT